MAGNGGSFLWVCSGVVHELTGEHMDEMLDFFESSAVSDESPLYESHPFVQLPAQTVQVQNMTKTGTGADADSTAEAGSSTKTTAEARPHANSTAEAGTHANSTPEEESQIRHGHMHKHHSHAHALGEVHGVQTNPATG